MGISKMFEPKDSYFLSKSKKMYCVGCPSLKTAREHGVVGSERKNHPHLWRPRFWCSIVDRQICTSRARTPFFCPLSGG